MAMLTRDDLLAKEDLKIDRVDFDDGGHIFVKQMTAREKEGWEMSLMSEIKDKDGKVTDYERSPTDFRAKLVVRTACDEDGELIFLPEDYETMSQNMGAKRMETIVDKAQALNKISNEDRDKMIKNSDGGQDADSSSDSVES
jgi:hypothetical protein